MSLQAEGNPSIDAPRLGELVAIILAGLVHVVTEVWLWEPVALAYSAAVSIAFLGYLVRRAARNRGLLEIWGIRVDNLSQALRAQLVFAATGAIVLLGTGGALGSLALPGAFWLTLVLYPIWAFAQQFALQNLIARNLAGICPNPIAIAAVASALFSISHFPRLELMLLTFLAGIFFTLIYRRFPNLWAVSIAHGVLGSLAVYLVLDEDPGTALLRYVARL